MMIRLELLNKVISNIILTELLKYVIGNIILKEKQKKYQHYLKKLLYECLTGEEI